MARLARIAANRCLVPTPLLGMVATFFRCRYTERPAAPRGVPLLFTRKRTW